MENFIFYKYFTFPGKNEASTEIKKDFEYRSESGVKLTCRYDDNKLSVKPFFHFNLHHFLPSVNMKVYFERHRVNVLLCHNIPSIIFHLFVFFLLSFLSYRFAYKIYHVDFNQEMIALLLAICMLLSFLYVCRNYLVISLPMSLKAHIEFIEKKIKRDGHMGGGDIESHQR